MNQNQQSTSQTTALAPENSVRFVSGVITGQADNLFSVSADGVDYTAKRAFDCMTQPEPGDLIVLTITPEGHFISQILSRETDTAQKLAFSNDLSIVSEGTIRVNGQTGMQLQTPAELEINSDKLAVNNLSTRFRTLNLFFQAKEAESNVGKLSLVADWIEQKSETIRQRFTRSDRVVKEADQQQAGSLVQRVDKTASLRAEHTIIKARKDVQVDGKRIHMG